MEKFLRQIQSDLDNKILSCINGETIVRPFSRVYEQVRDKKPKEKTTLINKKTLIYSEGEESIYQSVIAKFLKDNPDFFDDVKEDS